MATVVSAEETEPVAVAVGVVGPGIGEVVRRVM